MEFKNSYLQGVYDTVQRRNAGEPEFLQAVREVLESFEPVLDDEAVIRCIKEYGHLFDKVKIGKLNYHPSDINWTCFGTRVENLCKHLGLEYYIKESLRAEMEGMA